MAAISKSAYFDVLHDFVIKYNNSSENKNETN